MKKKISIFLAAALLVALPGVSAAADPAQPAEQTAIEKITEADHEKETTENGKPMGGKTSESETPSANTEAAKGAGLSEDTKVSEGEGASEDTKASEGETSSENASENEKEQEEAAIVETVTEAALIDAVSPEESAQIYQEVYVSRQEIWNGLAPYAEKADFYDDVGGDHWYRPGAGYCLSKGIITGLGDNIFGGAQNICRAQFITILYRMDGAPDTPFEQKFYDVPNGQFYSSAVTWGVNHDIIDAGSYFGPADDLPRAGMVEMMYRFAKYKGIDTNLTIDLAYQYEDASSVPGYAGQAFQWAVRSGLISGTDETHLSPNEICNRAECSTIIARYCEKYFPGQFGEVTYGAGCSSISVTSTDSYNGVFRVSVENVWGSHGVGQVKAQVWVKADFSDLKWVDLTPVGDGAYEVNCWAQYWDNQCDVYKAQIFVYLPNGLRYCVGSSWGEVRVSKLSSMRGEMQNICNAIYAEAGYDLYSCFEWVVHNIDYNLNDPYGWNWAVPSHFTTGEWYAYSGYQYRRGMCYTFASLFFMLAKGLGYDAELISGFVPQNDGSMAEHGWVQIGGLIYDASFEHDVYINLGYTAVSGFGFVYGTGGTYKYTDGVCIEK